ncbi:MAG: hypothetical protein ACYS9T_11355, partial [Planctomycetota bacterium]
MGPALRQITYQGLLYDANDVADGQYDFQFKLFDSFAGSKVDGDVNVPDVDVFDGYFTVELDFNDVYDGNERWLEIGVRPGEMNDPNVYTVLEPRQELTATPYALYALSGGGAGGGIGGSGTTDYIAKFTDPNTIGDSVISELASEVVISGRSLLLDNSQSYMSAASGGAATALLFMDGSDNVQIGDWAGGGDLYLRANGDRVIVKGSTGNVGIGTPSPEFKLTLDNDGGIIAKGTYNSGVDLTVSGAGTRLIWYPKKAAFRAGRVSGGQWDDPNIGTWSVAMGEDNTASGNWATVGGGLLNTSSGGTATVGGGYSNTASGGHTTIGGGFENTASASTATVGGGFENTARGVHATVGGGYYNDANGIGATVPGGYDNAASGVVSFAAGNRAKANHGGTFVWADNTDANFASTGANQFLIRASGGVGIGTPSPDRQLTVYNSGSAFQNVKDGTRELLMGVDSSGGIISAYTN